MVFRYNLRPFVTFTFGVLVWNVTELHPLLERRVIIPVTLQVLKGAILIRRRSKARDRLVLEGCTPEVLLDICPFRKKA